MFTKMSRRPGSGGIVLKLACLLGLLSCSLHCSRAAEEDGEEVSPHVFVSILARNSAHLLPNFLGYLEHLDYPKNRISVWIRSDHNVDSTPVLLDQWCKAAEAHYLSVDCYSSSEWLYPTEIRYKNMATLRQEALDTARKMGADYLFSVDTDCFLVNPRTLQLLMEQNKAIVAPMLDAPGDSLYSNFWMDQDDRGYYKRHEEYFPILKRSRTGCFQAPVVLATLLIHLSSPSSHGLVYDPPPPGYTGPVNDVLKFAFSAKTEGIGMFILNTDFFGYILKPEVYSDMKEAATAFLYLKLKSLVNHPPVLYSEYLSLPKTPKDNLGLDAVYVINLERRPERRKRMSGCLEELNLNYTFFDAVDGRTLNDSYVESLGIHYMPNWKDPWGDRPMTMGEVGCFLSHYTIWNKVLSEGLQRVLVFEDDVNFEANFKDGILKALKEAERHTPTWDFIYVGRKPLDSELEEKVKGTTHLIHPHYSYWLLGYLLSNRGARKLLEADPFQNLLPADEYVPILSGQHPRQDWAQHFPSQNLEVYSVHPLLAFPTHYTRDKGWFSDTEPPPEILKQIRMRKQKEKMQKPEQMTRDMKVVHEHQEEIRKKALERQIKQMKERMAVRSEL